ncbi:aspartate-semialdehyde dehydrogenase [Pseudomonas rubra]|uniref:Aspartate-semialdehyde dehydrogenase n=1 Tax=Pseudomonas rubra TaxID=2942627 RepID=A0ABT5PFZ1_9PSED|nr:aspartate-semialdehyde dehydrogenase [Pseudomonas rubra]MDD1017218.1 aspartate-semialdehyde dehydrogenase [Pseudomonas rubra]MDD1041165.1 aspartate-semialdehyde dehydrogenase [Pseudomonas rubra]MDD1157749.1 aspartate-semialdehyde dehydrogenase [Pseudomonas rubra]
MLPPLIPLSAAPVTQQLDPVKPTPDIKPVVPAQPTSSDSAIDLKHRDPEQAAILLREEQRRHQRRRQSSQDQELYQALPGDEVNADNTVPVAPLMGEQPRQGLLVDIEV